MDNKHILSQVLINNYTPLYNALFTFLELWSTHSRSMMSMFTKHNAYMTGDAMTKFIVDSTPSDADGNPSILHILCPHTSQDKICEWLVEFEGYQYVESLNM